MMSEKEELELLRTFLVRHFRLNENPSEDFPNILNYAYACGQSEYHEHELEDGGDPNFQAKLLWAYRNGSDDPEEFDLEVLKSFEGVKEEKATREVRYGEAIEELKKLIS